MTEYAFNHNDSDLVDWLKQLIADGTLDGAGLGITKQFIDRGWDSLSDKQKFVFVRDVIEPNTINCKFRDCEIPWGEMYEASTTDGYCSSCRHDLQKNAYKDD